MEVMERINEKYSPHLQKVTGDPQRKQQGDK